MDFNFEHNQIKSNFTKVNNTIFEMDGLNMTEKYLYIYISSKPKDWNFSNDRIAKSLNIDKKTVRKYLQSLEDKNLLLRTRVKGNRTQYKLSDLSNIVDTQ